MLGCGLLTKVCERYAKSRMTISASLYGNVLEVTLQRTHNDSIHQVILYYMMSCMTDDGASLNSTVDFRVLTRYYHIIVMMWNVDTWS